METDGDFFARTAQVSQNHGYGQSRRDAVRHSKVHLLVARISGSVAEKQSLSGLAADGYLRRDRAAFNRLLAYIDGTSPAVAGLADDAIFPVSAYQTAPWPVPSPDIENGAGGGANNCGV